MSVQLSESTNQSEAARAPCLRLHADDNVAVALDDLGGGAVTILADGERISATALESIARGHKLAIRAIAAGERVLKYGVVIGFAMEPIPLGAWVHTHNCKSGLDERSHTLDRHTGAPTDTKYV
jgi:altronate dehydratase small subunit